MVIWSDTQGRQTLLLKRFQELPCLCSTQQREHPALSSFGIFLQRQTGFFRSRKSAAHALSESHDVSTFHKETTDTRKNFCLLAAPCSSQAFSSILHHRSTSTHTFLKISLVFKNHTKPAPAGLRRRPGCWTAGWTPQPSCRCRRGWSQCSSSAGNLSRSSWCQYTASPCQKCIRKLFKNKEQTAHFRTARWPHNTLNILQVWQYTFFHSEWVLHKTEYIISDRDPYFSYICVLLQDQKYSKCISTANPCISLKTQTASVKAAQTPHKLWGWGQCKQIHPCCSTTIAIEGIIES